MSQGGHSPGKPGLPGKVREFQQSGKSLGKVRKFGPRPGKILPPF